MNNRIDQLFEKKKNNILSVYFTAGFPRLDDTVKIIEELQENGVDLIEIGMPFSDPTADGPTLQHSNNVALKNGMSIKVLFNQLNDIRKNITIPLILMGYINPVIRYGVEDFCKKCAETGIDGLILPDLPPEELENNYSSLFKKYNLYNILLVSPQTSDQRIRQIDNLSDGFLYIVSAASTTGAGRTVDNFDVKYFERLKNMQLKKPGIIGFGISDRETFVNACNYAQGAIIGSAFVEALQNGQNIKSVVKDFTGNIRSNI
jgi:tryptophan synthase alpha chain